MKTTNNEHLFEKLKNKFGIKKSDEQIFVPKKLAQQIIQEARLDPTEKKKPAKVKDVVTSNIKSKNIFDLDDVSDIDPEVTQGIIQCKPEHERSVSSRIFQLFNIAKEVNMDTLTIDQITSAYYKVYTANGKDILRTKKQIATKIYNMDYYGSKNQQSAHLVKIANKDSTYTMSNFKPLEG